MKFTLTILVGLVVCASAYSQPVPDSKGRDFWFTFLPNYHNEMHLMHTALSTQLEHQIYIYIGSETPTSGTITLYDSTGIPQNVPFQITDPTKLYEFRTLFLPYELRGFNYHGVIDTGGMRVEEVHKISIHVVANDDVTVYAMNQGWFTSDAFLVLPTDAIGTDYCIMSYTSDFRNLSNAGANPNSTPSQFAIVATEDNTVVNMVPSTSTFKVGAFENNTITLNQGDSYLVQDNPYLEDGRDLTGSILTSSKPIAVFAGHQRALIPIANLGSLGSRDCLVEQMNPISTWGKRAFITELAHSQDELDFGTNIFRVVAAFDSTEIFINDVSVGIINASGYYEAPLIQAAEVYTSHPTLIAMFKKTAGGAGVSDQRNGDPFMMLVPPSEQFMDKYRFINVQAYNWEVFGQQTVQGEAIYEEQYLNVVIASEKVGTMVLDGTPLPASSFMRIGSSDYSWARFPMSDGVHDIHADTIFGIYVYGYGPANSYGYIGGMAFRPLDNFPPKFRGTTVCNIFAGRVTDSVLGDSRLRSIEVVPGSDTNVVFTLGSFAPPQPSASFTLSLANPFLDGRISLEAFDHAKQKSRISINVPGFTIGVQGRGGDPNPELKDKTVPVRRLRCDTVVLHNYGRFAHQINSIKTTGNATIGNANLPVTLAPQDTLAITLCWDESVGGVTTDTIIIGDSCVLRECLIYTVTARDDEVSPRMQSTSDSCLTSFNVVVADDRDFDFGLRSVRTLDSIQVNCTVAMDFESVSINRYTVSVTDPLYDAIYGFEAIDSADNVTRLIDTIQGFTIAFDGVPGWTSSKSIESIPVGSAYCDTVIVSNYGLKEQIITEAFIKENTLFSIPQGQFNIVLPPGASAPFVVCYEPFGITTDPDHDTIVFWHGCFSKEIDLSAMGGAAEYSGVSRCNVPVDVLVEKANRLLVVPNPASNIVTLVFDSEVDELSLRISDVAGIGVLQREWKGIPTRALQVELGNLPAGAYSVRARIGRGIKTAVLIVN